MKMVQKVALAVLSVGVLIGLGTHIDAIYHGKNKKAQALDMSIDAGTARKKVKGTKAKRKKKMQDAQAKQANTIAMGGISMHMVDKQQNESYLLFKKVEKHYGFMNEADIVTVAIPMAENIDLKNAKLWGKAGKFKFYTQEVNDWEKPAHDTRDYVWISEQELQKAVSMAQNNAQGSVKDSKVNMRTKQGQRVELDKNLLAALTNHYGKLELKAKKAKAKIEQKAEQVVATDKKKTGKKAKTKTA
jgi:hypothetical protein